jgi:hypothetical protein
MSFEMCGGSIPKEFKEVTLSYENVKVKSLAVFKEPGSLKSYQRQHRNPYPANVEYRVIS